MIYSAYGITDTSVTVNPLLVVSVLPTLSGQYCSHFFYKIPTIDNNLCCTLYKLILLCNTYIVVCTVKGTLDRLK